MSFRHQLRSIRHNLRWRRAIEVLLLCALVVGVFPSPESWLPGSVRRTLETRVAKDRSRPFPCQDRPCGCQSAEQCRQSCCCFRAEEKQAWAAAAGIPASEVISDVDSLKSIPAAADSGSVSRACCVARKNSLPATRVTRSRGILLVLAEKCRGNQGRVMVWRLPEAPVRTLVGVSIPPQWSWEIVVRLLSDQIESSPALPPPRRTMSFAPWMV